MVILCISVSAIKKKQRDLLMQSSIFNISLFTSVNLLAE
jgi:hypothetical protein